MSNIIDKIQLSGVTYTIGGGGGGTGGTAVEEMTQAQYDAAATAGTLDDETLYIITDAEEINANDYVTKASNVASGLTVTVERTGTYNNLQNVKDVYISADTNCSMVNVYFNSNYYGITITFDFQTTPSFGYDYMRVDFDSENRTYHVWSTDTNLFFYYVYAQNYEGSETFKLWVYTWQIPSGQTASVLNNALPEIASVIDDAKNTLVENINFTTNTGQNYWVYNIKKGGTENGYTWQVCDGKEIVNKDGLKLGNIPTQTVYSSELLNASTCEYYPLGTNWVDYPNAIQHFVLKFNYNFYDNTEFSLQINYYFNSGSGSGSKYIYGRCNNGTIEVNFGDGNWSSDYAALTSSIQNDTNLDITITSDGIEYVKGTGGTEWISYLYCGNCLYYGSNRQDSPFSSMTEYKNSIGIYDAVETLFGNYEDGKYVETSAITSAVTSASTDAEIPTAKAVYDAIPQGGGGKAIEAGTNISITTGTTADTINCTLPITANTGSITFGGYSSNPNTNNGKDCLVTGCDNIINSNQSQFCLLAGYHNTIGGGFMGSDAAVVLGFLSSANSDFAVAMGDHSNANKESSFALGKYVDANNIAEHSVGKYNVSNTGSTTADKTLFSVGNGTNSARHNAFEIRQNGDIYIVSGSTDIKLQDQLGGSSYTAGDGIDITNDVISVTGKVDTSTYNTYTAATDAALATKQTTLTAGTNITIVDNVISATGGGGGSTYTAGRGIDITNDTISFSLPISAGTGTNSIIENYTSNVASGSYSHAEGRGTTAGTGSYTHAEGYNTKASGSYSHAEGASSLASGSYTHAEGSNTKASGQYSHAEGYYTTASTDYTHAEGYNTKASGKYSHAEGSFTTAKNEAEHASGQYNVSSSASTTFGDSGNTLFSVGNGTNSARHNAFEIRQNGDIYYFDGTNDVKLQDKFSSIDTTIGDINTILQSI